jgi:hypothetical protein
MNLSPEQMLTLSIILLALSFVALIGLVLSFLQWKRIKKVGSATKLEVDPGDIIIIASDEPKKAPTAIKVTEGRQREPKEITNR